MNHTTHTRDVFAPRTVLLLITLLFPLIGRAGDTAGTPSSRADEQPLRLEEIEVSEPRTSAASMAPTDSSLDAVEPQSVISLQTIQNSIPPTADYAMIANLAPSVTNFSTNGPGLNESKLTMRGFVDGQYNVTIDGIPFGDGNDYTHHTTSYFPAKLLGRVTVDRGPGTASTIGMATFGGTVALETKDPRTEPSFVPTLSYGSWDTQLGHFEVNTGLLPQANNGSLIASYQYMASDGYRTFGTLRRNTYFTKYLQPIGKHTTLSIMGEYNNIKFNNPNRTLSLQDIYTLGRNFGQTNDPNDRNGDYYGTNYQSKHTDTEIIGLNSDLDGGWTINNKVYSFSYDNSSHESPNTNAGATISPTTGKVVAGKDLGGQFKVNVVRAYGDVFGAAHEDNFGTFKTGVWFDYQHGPRYNYFLDYNVANAEAIGLVPMPGGFLDANHSSSAHGYAWNMHFYTRTWEPYVEYEWSPLPNLTITPGLKYMWVDRVIEAKVNQTKDLLPLYFDQSFSQTLPLVTANYKLNPNWSAYVQYADGFLTPPLAFYQEDNPALNNVKPQTTVNYQVGTVYKTNRFNADVDAYWIDYSHLPVQFVDPNQTGIPNPNDLIYFDAAGGYYYGVEGEATYYVGQGLSAFVNGSRNYATYKKSKRRIESIPQSTGGFGFVYDHAGFFSSVMAKYTGPYTVYSGAPSPDLPLPTSAFAVVQGGYTLVGVSLGYGHKFGQRSFFKSYKIRLQIDNALNRDVILLKSPKAVSSAYSALLSTYNVVTPRGYFLTVSGEF